MGDRFFLYLQPYIFPCFLFIGIFFLTLILISIYSTHKKTEKLYHEYSAILKAKEQELGRKMTNDEIEFWLMGENLKIEIKNADEFARKLAAQYK